MPTSTSEQAFFVFAIEGLGLDGVASITPIPLACGVAPPATSVFDDSYVPIVNRDSVRVSGTSISPLSGDPRAGGIEFTLLLDDDSYPEISRFFLSHESALEPDTTIADGSDIAVADTDHVIDGTPSTVGIAQHSITYIGREAFRVASVTDASSLYTIVDEFPDPDDLTARLVRSTEPIAEGDLGHFWTRASGHEAWAASGQEEPYPDHRVWLTNPMVANRAVWVYKVSANASNVWTEELWGRYFIVEEPEFDGVEVTVKAVDAIGYIAQQTLNRSPNVWVVDSGWVYPSDAVSMNLRLTLKDNTTAVDDSVWTDTAWKASVPLQVDKSVIVTRSGNSPANRALDYRYGTRFAYYDSDDLEGGAKAKSIAGKRVYEVLFSDPLDENSLVGDYVAATQHPYYSSTLSRVCNHPLEMLLCHLGAISSNLPEHWKCDLPANTVDVDGINRLRDRYSQISTWPGVIGGKDGKSIKAMKWFSEALGLSALGMSLGVTSDGKVTVYSFTDFADAGTIDASRILFGRGGKADVAYSFERHIVKMGAGYKDFPRVILRTMDGYKPVLSPSTVRELDFDVSGPVHPDDPVTDAVHERPMLSWMVHYMRAFASAFRYPPRRWSVKVSGATRIAAGEWKLFTAPGFRRSSDGQMPDSAYTFLGWITGEHALEDKYPLSGQELTVYEMPFDISWIGPAAVVSSYTKATGTFKVGVSALYIKPLRDGAYTVGDSTADDELDQFEAGMKVVVVDKNLVVLTDPFEIESIDTVNTEIVVAAADRPVQTVGGSDYAYAGPNERIVLADYTDARAADQADYAFVDRNTYTA